MRHDCRWSPGPGFSTGKNQPGTRHSGEILGQPFDRTEKPQAPIATRLRDQSEGHPRRPTSRILAGTARRLSVGGFCGEQHTDKAIEALAAAVPYELGNISENVNVAPYPAYFRGEAYLAAHQGAAADAEFRKLIAHSGVVGNSRVEVCRCASQFVFRSD